MEWVSLAPSAAAGALRDYPRQADLHQWIQNELDKGEKGLARLEHIESLRARSGQRARVESTFEVNWPSEFSSPQMVSSLGIGVPAGPAGSAAVSSSAPLPTPGTPAAGGGPAPAAKELPGEAWKLPATPTNFQTKTTGWTVEMELVLAQDLKSADINLAPEFVSLAGFMPMDTTGQIKQPIFENRRITTQLNARIGKPVLVGTMNPPLDAKLPDGNKESRVWLMFMAVTLPE